MLDHGIDVRDIQLVLHAMRRPADRTSAQAILGRVDHNAVDQAVMFAAVDDDQTEVVLHEIRRQIRALDIPAAVLAPTSSRSGFAPAF